MKKGVLSLNNKKGLSAVITTLIIILLVIVAVGIVWVVVKGVIDETVEGISLDSINSGLEVERVVTGANEVKVTVYRSKGEVDLAGFNIVISDGESSEVFEQLVSMSGLERKTFTLTYTGIVKTVSIAPIFTTDEGIQKAGEIVDSFEFQTTCVENIDCGTDSYNLVCSSPTGDVVNRSTAYTCDGGSCNTVTSDVAPTITCASGCCGAACVDTQTDESNCGSCGTSCTGGQSCISGLCEDCRDACEVGSCGDFTQCGGGTLTCAAATYCGANTECGGNSCQCLTGYGNCDGDWSNGCEVNLQTTVANCGSCGYDCQTEESLPGCASGVCVDSSDVTYAGDQIRDLDSPSNRIAELTGYTSNYIYARGFCQVVKGCGDVDIPSLVLSIDNQLACRCESGSFGCSGGSCWTSNKYWTSITCTDC
jgi:hypothetical protein